MAHVGTLRDYRFQGDIDDIRGSNIYNRNDDKLGDIDDVIFNHASGEIEYLVVDTGGWLSSHKFLVPADRVSATDDDDRYVVDLTKEQIERFPEYNEKLHEEDKNWRDYEGRYRESWTEAGGVLHREGSPNILTPDASEMPAASGSGTNADVTPTRLAPKFTNTAPSSDKLRMRPEGTASQAEDTRFPGTARNTETSNWQKPENEIETEREESGIPRSGVRPVSLANDTGRNISDADLTEETADLTDESAKFRDESAYGDVRRTVAPHADAGDPGSYQGRAVNLSNDLSRPYPVQEGRGERWRAFEENLRRNRVDITASCRACNPAKDRAA